MLLHFWDLEWLEVALFPYSGPRKHGKLSGERIGSDLEGGSPAPDGFAARIGRSTECTVMCGRPMNENGVHQATIDTNSLRHKCCERGHDSTLIDL